MTSYSGRKVKEGKIVRVEVDCSEFIRKWKKDIRKRPDKEGRDFASARHASLRACPEKI